MARHLRKAVEDVFKKKVKIIVDKYHIQRTGIQAIRNFLNKPRKVLTTKNIKEIKPDRFLLFKRSYNHSDKEWQKLEKWAQKSPQLAEIYNLKEEFMQIWKYADKQKAIEAFDRWKNKIPDYLKYAFKETLDAFKRWSEQIFNYFDCRVTNAYTESANNIVKSIRKQSRGCDFYTMRAKMLLRSFSKLKESEKHPPKKTHNYSSVQPSKEQRVLRLQQSCEQNSEVFAIYSEIKEKALSGTNRLAHHQHLFRKYHNEHPEPVISEPEIKPVPTQQSLFPLFET
jgi:hypothetical protein